MRLIKKSSMITLLSCSMVGFAAGLFSGCSDNNMNMNMGEYSISLLTPKHFHAFTTTDTLFFKVTNSKGEPKAGLTPMISCKLGAGAPTETMEGDIIDNHDGIYYWRTSFLGAGTYVISFKFDHNDMMYTNAFSLEASYAGGERIFLPDSISPVHNYQVRWTLAPGKLRGGMDTAIFSIELKRSINSPVIIDKPYTNTFDHLAPSDLVPAGSLPTVLAGPSEGSEDTLAVTYAGLGVYKVKKVFPAVMAATAYGIHVVFSDSTGKVDESGSNYKFTVFPSTM